MKSQKEWFEEYAESHQNITNQRIHYVCVPLIFFSIVGMIMSIPSGTLSHLLGFYDPVFVNWAAPILLLLMLFYIRLSFKTFFLMLLFSLFSLYGNYLLSEMMPLLYTSIAIFIIAWIGQFYGHKVEGKKPSFFKDLQFLLIGPAWVFEKMSR
ncbi:DUF962 domain-containing protein [bacterium SCSIO 12643]|nr:DUF962 domain-containing protein [bacterium SCSIO 12643]